ncbi:MAG: glycosyltransferase [Clostridia bacterium]|nr:glycosyltransferase [Clostridia bacterium]
MNIHVIGTVNGEVNEGMRNIATHISHAFEKEHTVIYSGLRQLPKIIFDSKKADVTLIFAWADKRIYDLVKAVSTICPHIWVVLVQKPAGEFLALARENPLECSYLYIFDDDVKELTVAEGRALRRFSVGINTDKFLPPKGVDTKELKEKYGFDPVQPLVLHVGHCSGGRGLEDFLCIKGAQRLIIASGMFEDEQLVKRLEEDGVTVMSGYLDNVEEIFQMADAYLFPTRSTQNVISIPLSVMEALACGVPVIGYSSFENLGGIGCADGAVTFIDSPDEIDRVLPSVMAKKSRTSMLHSVGSWSDTAAEILRIISEEG